MKIGILGCRGIPNNYGGFEQFAQYISYELVRRGHNVFVYNAHNHPYKKSSWEDVNIIRCWDPEKLIGSAGPFLYDLFCILDARKQNFDIILQLGYGSSSIWSFLEPKKSALITNADGLEWNRNKYNKFLQIFLQWAESRAVKSSKLIIADSPVIRNYFIQKYTIEPAYIPYGAISFTNPTPEILTEFQVLPEAFFMVLCRMQVDNHVEEVINGVLMSESEKPLLVIGNISNSYGKKLYRKYSSHRIRFIGTVYNINTLNNLRYFSSLYFHGHSSGGTNPSLIEAMASQAFICAHNNPFNRQILNNNALFFSDSSDIAEIINKSPSKKNFPEFTRNNLEKVVNEFDWQKITDNYILWFNSVLKKQ